MTSDNITFYSDNADLLVSQYESTTFEEVHSDWLVHLPTGGKCLDVGSGSGRDAVYLATRGFDVTAVEPAHMMRQIGKQKHAHTNIAWVDDRLPELLHVKAMHTSFDLILLSAVWMHIPPCEREKSLCNLAKLLKNNALLVITLRHGTFVDSRECYPSIASELVEIGKVAGMTAIYISDVQEDVIGRKDVAWQSVCLRKDSEAYAR